MCVIALNCCSSFRSRSASLFNTTACRRVARLIYMGNLIMILSRCDCAIFIAVSCRNGILRVSVLSGVGGVGMGLTRSTKNLCARIFGTRTDAHGMFLAQASGWHQVHHTVHERNSFFSLAAATISIFVHSARTRRARAQIAQMHSVSFATFTFNANSNAALCNRGNTITLRCD